MITNRLITRGLSLTSRNLLVTRGLIPGVFKEIVEQSRQAVLRLGRSGAKAGKEVYDRVEEIVVFAKLLKVNNVEPTESIKGWVRISYDRLRRIFTEAAKTAFTTVKSRIDSIVISVKRIK